VLFITDRYSFYKFAKGWAWLVAHAHPACFIDCLGVMIFRQGGAGVSGTI
jgi:hypothetical protein